MTLRAKHIELIEAVNNAKTEPEHFAAEFKLAGWREGVRDAGANISYLTGDEHYIAKGIDRPMCCGVFLDWKPS